MKMKNAENLCKIALDTDPIDTNSIDINIMRESLSTAHTAIGNGTAYGQDVYSNVHIDMVLMESTILGFLRMVNLSSDKRSLTLHNIFTLASSASAPASGTS